jgi:hypothetical protein
MIVVINPVTNAAVAITTDVNYISDGDLVAVDFDGDYGAFECHHVVFDGTQIVIDLSLPAPAPLPLTGD